MGVLFDYFSAASDEAAASAIGILGGPGTSSARTHGEPSLDTVSDTGIDPLVQLGTLEALLTGREYEHIVAGPRAGHALAVRAGGEVMVVTLTDELQAALADASDPQLDAVAVRWSQTDEFSCHGDPRVLSELRELAELARRAQTRDERMYCWTSV
jgi:hypothetical protein